MQIVVNIPTKLDTFVTKYYGSLSVTSDRGVKYELKVWANHMVIERNGKACCFRPDNKCKQALIDQAINFNWIFYRERLGYDVNFSHYLIILNELREMCK